MKTNKASEETEVTPSKKKLKQARLPFKTISEGSPTSGSVQTRKRKLSASDSETTPKLGKICKENDPIEDLVVISDDDSKDEQKTQKQEKSMNPFVKLVDTAWKKKMQKTKTTKRKRSSRNKSLTNGSVENESGNDTAEEKGLDDNEMMDVDEPNEETDDIKKNDKDKQTESNSNTPNNKSNHIGSVVIIDEKNVPSETVTVNQKKNNKVKQNVDMNLAESHEDEGNISQPSKPKEDKQSPHKSNEIVDQEIILESDSSNKSSSDSDTDTNSPENKNDKSPTTDSKSITDESNKISPNETVIVTPKRSARNKAKKELNNTALSPNVKLNESVTSNPTTPKKSRSSSVTSAPGNESLNDSSTVQKNLTPKQLQKKLESAKKREEREKEKQEREKKRQQEKEERAKQKQEKEEQKRKDREEKEEQKRKEKEEKEKQKEVEKKLREEKEEQKRKEKEEKEEQRRKEKEARDEEKRKKQEAIELEKHEQELKKKKAAEAFVNFFVPKQKSEKDQTTVGPVSKNSVLSSFTIKTDMRLAPTKRVDLEEEQINILDSYLQHQNGTNSQLYLKSLKNGISKPLSSGKTWPISEKDDDVMIVEDELPPMDAAGESFTCEPAPREKLRPKLLSFHENRRPPYWGTWRKKSASIKPRKPFGQDQKQLDYEVDSDEEWEEEQEGESIDGSAAGSDDEQEADEYEVDNEVFVPHGYLSDEEATMDDDDVLSLSPETQKARLKHLEDEFESEMKKPTEKLKPRMYGLLWETADASKPEKCVDSLWNYFGKLSMIMDDPTHLLQPSNEPEETEKKKVKKKKVAPSEKNDQKSPKQEKKKKAKAENKEAKPANKIDSKKNVSEIKNQPGINVFLAKLKSS